jgi:hypothetical protein
LGRRRQLHRKKFWDGKRCRLVPDKSDKTLGDGHWVAIALMRPAISGVARIFIPVSLDGYRFVKQVP